MFILRVDQPPELLRDYIKASELADLDRKLVPHAAPARLNFTGPIISADIPFVSGRAETTARNYNQEVPRSQEARRRLDQLRRQCFALLRQTLDIPHTTLDSQIELFASDGRALEVALNRFGPEKNLILSPFERDAIAETAAWHCRNSCATLRRLSVPETADWRSQSSKMVEEIRSLLDPDRVNLLVFAEVNPITGITLPLPALVQSVRQTFAAYRVKIVVDGTDSVGNGGTLRFLDSADAYLFSANKWLMAPEPGSVLILKEPSDLVAYDAWTATGPAEAQDIRIIAGLSAALELLKSNGLDFFWNRSRLLQEAFLERIRKKQFEVIGESAFSDGQYAERTLMCCVRPLKGTRWRPDFVDRLERARLGIRINNPSNPALASVTVAFAYYLSIWHVNELCLVLSEATESWGGVSVAAKA
jgi:selenocysteine lyase/cysteine desulfurase